MVVITEMTRYNISHRLFNVAKPQGLPPEHIGSRPVRRGVLEAVSGGRVENSGKLSIGVPQESLDLDKRRGKHVSHA